MPTVSQVHKQITQTAASIANHMLASDDELAWRFSGDIFKEASVASDKTKPGIDGLCLIFEVNLDQFPSPEREQIASKMHQIGRTAMRLALLQHKREFVGLIVGSAHQGKNYFDNFVSEDTRPFQ